MLEGVGIFTYLHVLLCDAMYLSIVFSCYSSFVHGCSVPSCIMLVGLMLFLTLTFVNDVDTEMDKNVNIEHSRVIQV